PTAEKKWSFYRSKNEKMLGGVCAGLAQTLAIDPIAVRLIFVLITLLQVATLFKVNFGIIAYLLLWVLLPSKETVSQISRKLFRDPQFRILGGVCSGLAKFFSLQVWMIRVLFLAPFLLEIINDNWFDDAITFSNVSINGISFIVYVVLWLITPMAQKTTDYMLLNGAPVNLNTIQQASQIERQQEKASGGITKLLRVLAYIVMGLFLLVLVPIVVSMGLGTFIAFRAADFVLFSTFHKSLAFLVMVLVFILPLLALLFGIIRRLAGYAKPHRALRKTILGLHLLGWLAGAMLVYSLLQQHQTISRKKTNFTFKPMVDTLRVVAGDQDSVLSDDLFSVNAPNNLIQLRGNAYRCRTVWVKFHRSTDSMIRVEVLRRATGKNGLDAEKELARFNIQPRYEQGVLQI
ncbi:MAG: PspC domain-containing protein, partial [Chitinophagaceae bacterium]|nr:PspC domain-containing protein [Chitinophagaceae bacterium]